MHRFCILISLLAAFALSAADRPNIVLIYCDDLGYVDIGPYGSKTPTPNLDRMAREGIRFTDFYVAQAVCSASRAALLTGCYPNRIGIQGALNPGARYGIHSNEVTVAELLKPRGYATAVYGKWHLGHHPEFLPTRHGFDEYFGLPYSNDMWPRHPTAKFPELPLIEGEKTVELDPDQSRLTRQYTERAVQFIQRKKDQPFFLYLAHTMPHVPLFMNEQFKGKSGRGLYGDVITEIDWSVGEILKAINQHGLDEQTLVIFTSDNGPWLSYGNHAGSAGPLREGKMTVFEGGVRVPCLMRWPGKIRANSICRQPAMTIDLLPTVARLAGAKLPKHRIDGSDIRSLILGRRGAKSPHQALFFYWAEHLQAVRSGKWKLHFPHDFAGPEPPGQDGKPGKITTKRIGAELFDLDADPGETINMANQHPDVVKRLEALAERCRDDLGDSISKRIGRNVRPAGRLASQ